MWIGFFNKLNLFILKATNGHLWTFPFQLQKKPDLNKKKKKKNISFTKLYNLFQSIGTRFFQLSKHIKVTVIQMSRLQKLCKHKNRMAGLQFETEL